MKGASAIDEAKRLQPAYTPNELVTGQLRDKNIIMFVAPGGTGKTHLIREVAGLHSAFSPVSVFTTRAARPDDDPGMFRLLPHDDTHVRGILKSIETGELVQYIVHPSGRLYGTNLGDYPAEYNMIAMLSGAVGQIRTLPFKTAFVVGVVTELAAWIRWFDDRFPLDSDERPKRLAEAKESLEWLLAQPAGACIWATNTPGKAALTAKSIINAILYNKSTPDASYLAERMLITANKMPL